MNQPIVNPNFPKFQLDLCPCYPLLCIKFRICDTQARGLHEKWHTTFSARTELHPNQGFFDTLMTSFGASNSQKPTSRLEFRVPSIFLRAGKSSSSSSSSSSIYTLYRPKAQSGEDKLRGSQPTLDLDVQSLENQIKNAAASQIAHFPRIQHSLRPNNAPSPNRPNL